MPIIKDIVYESVPYGASVTEMCRRIGMQPAELDDGDRWVDLETGHRTWQAALELTGQPLLGLFIGRNGNPYVIGLLGALMESCPDLGTALDSLSRYNDYFGNLFRYRGEKLPDRYVFHLEPAPAWQLAHPETARQAVDTSLTRSLAIMRRFTGKSIRPLRVEVTYTLPDEQRAIYEELLGARVFVQQSGNRLLFDPGVAALPVVSHNAALYRQLAAFLEQQLTELATNGSLADRIRRLVLNHLGQPWPTLAAMARELQLPERTLQRRLAGEGLTYQELLDDIRRHYHAAWTEQERPAAELSAVLGYSSPAAFYRARRRWTNV